MPAVDADALLEWLREYVSNIGFKRALGFAAYDSIARQQAACGAGHAANYMLLDGLLTLAPSAEVSFSRLKSAVFATCAANPSLMGGAEYRPGIFAGLKAERIMTMLNHIRRVARCKVRLAQMRSKCSAREFEAVEKLLKKIQLNEAAPFASESGSADGVTPVKKRRLEPQPSVDSQGYPMFLAHAGDVFSSPPAAVKEQKRSSPLGHAKKRSSREEHLAALSAALPDVPADAVSALAAWAAGDQAAEPAVQESKGAEPKSSAKAARKGARPACKANAPAPAAVEAASKGQWVSAAFGKLFLTQASSQSYIQFLDANTSKKVLLVSFSAGAYPNHREVVVQMAAWVCAAGGDLNKSAVQQRKASLRSAES